jgi:hypothetical protein
VRELTARRSFDVVDVTEIFIRWYAGRSLSEVSVSLGLPPVESHGNSHPHRRRSVSFRTHQRSI